MENREIPHMLSFDGDQVRVTAELPFITEEKIRIDLDGTILSISAAERNRQFDAQITLPWGARFGMKRFRKGVLELTLERSER